jgi:type I restriction enzyme S subunit
MVLTQTNAALSKSKGYKSTEVGLIPEAWEVLELNDLTNITRLAGYEYSTLWEETPNGEIIALRGFNIGKNSIIEKDFVTISDILSKRLIRSRLFKGDIIYPCVGTIGNAAVIREDDKYHIQQNIAKITPSQNKIDSDYLAYYLMSDYGLKEIEKFNGSSSQPNILVGSLRQYSIIVPTLTEQKAIATALSDVDALISSLEKLIVKKKAIKQGAMQELLTPPHKGGKRLVEFSGTWEELTLGQCLLESPKYGINAPAVVFNLNLPTYLRITDFDNNGKVDVLNLKSVNHVDSSNYILDVDDIVLARTGASVGKAYLHNSEKIKFVFAGFLIQIKPNKSKLQSDFLFQYLMTNKYWNWVQIMSMRSGQPGINGNEYRSLPLFIPSLEEQKAIAQILSDMDKEIESLGVKKEKYQQIKQGMMQELLMGKTRLVWS